LEEVEDSIEEDIVYDPTLEKQNTSKIKMGNIEREQFRVQCSGFKLDSITSHIELGSIVSTQRAMMGNDDAWKCVDC